MNTSAYLQNQGWRGQGFSLDHSNRGLAKPLLVAHKHDLGGLGTKKNDFGNQWWTDAFDKSLKAFGTDKAATPATASPHKIANRRGLYASFVKAETLKSTITDDQASLSNDTGSKTGDSTPSSSGMPAILDSTRRFGVLGVPPSEAPAHFLVEDKIDDKVDDKIELETEPKKGKKRKREGNNETNSREGAKKTEKKGNARLSAEMKRAQKKGAAMGAADGETPVSALPGSHSTEETLPASAARDPAQDGAEYIELGKQAPPTKSKKKKKKKNKQVKLAKDGEVRAEGKKPKKAKEGSTTRDGRAEKSGSEMNEINEKKKRQRSRRKDAKKAKTQEPES